MFSKMINGLTAVLVLIVATTAQAAPTSRNKINLMEEIDKTRELSEKGQTHLSQISQVELLYEAYLLTKTFEKAKPKAKSRNNNFVKVAFNPESNDSKKTYSKSLRVTATAYTSHVNQTDSTPNIAAWGDRLHPGMKSIAVSRDLLKIHGLKHGQKVRIKGLKGEYAVLDKMNKRWNKKIDIYMGMDKRKAFKWGRRKVEILWN